MKATSALGMFCLVGLLSGCLTNTFETSEYKTLSKTKLLSEILIINVIPLNDEVYRPEAASLAMLGLSWQDIANYQSSCQAKHLSKNAKREDLEVIHYIFVTNIGAENAAKASVKAAVGTMAYEAGITAYGGSAFDCLLETQRYIDGQKG